MFWHVTCLSIHHSVCPQGGGGGSTRGRSSRGGVHQPGPGGWGGGVPCQGGGVTLPRVPPIRPDWGVPPLDLAGGYPAGGYPTLATPHQIWPGGYPIGYPPSDLARGVPEITDEVLDTPRSVCLLRLRRRTFLFKFTLKTWIGLVDTCNNYDTLVH